VRETGERIKGGAVPVREGDKVTGTSHRRAECDLTESRITWGSQAAHTPSIVIASTARLSAPKMVVKSLRDYMLLHPGITPSPANHSIVSSVPHVPPSTHARLISRFPANFHKCPEGIRKTHEKGPSCTPARCPASGLRLSQRHSRRHSPATRGTPSVPESR
jgi:hypothetical protein